MTAAEPARHYEYVVHDEAHYARDFDRHLNDSSADFWRRYGGQPDVRGKRVLDFGSATGGMIHRLMQAGAASAVGIDLDVGSSDYARKRLADEWGDRVTILCEDVRTVDVAPADLIVSQNTMEHISPLQDILDAVVRLCKPGGEMYFGYAPLWHSPFGHHHNPRTNLPWLHLLRGDQIVLDALERKIGRRYASIPEAGFNRATVADFRAAFAAQPAEVIELRRNPGSGGWKSLVSQLLLIPAAIPSLEKYLTTGMYWHLRKTADRVPQTMEIGR